MYGQASSSLDSIIAWAFVWACAAALVLGFIVLLARGHYRTTPEDLQAIAKRRAVLHAQRAARKTHRATTGRSTR